MVKIGDVFYYERNGRYVTVYANCYNPKCWCCSVEEMNEDGEYEVSEHKLFMEYELLHFERR